MQDDFHQSCWLRASNAATLKVREVARELEYLIAHFQDRHPRATCGDVQQAVRVGGMRVGVGEHRQKATVIVLASGVGLLGLLS